MTTGYANIFEAMNSLSITRFIGLGTVSAAGLLDHTIILTYLGRPIFKLLLNSTFLDVVNTRAVLERLVEVIKWSWFRVAYVDDRVVGRYKVGYMGDDGSGMMPTIGRDDLAQAILDELKEPKYIRKTPVLWSV